MAHTHKKRAVGRRKIVPRGGFKSPGAGNEFEEEVRCSCGATRTDMILPGGTRLRGKWAETTK